MICYELSSRARPVRADGRAGESGTGRCCAQLLLRPVQLGGVRPAFWGARACVRRGRGGGGAEGAIIPMRRATLFSDDFASGGGREDVESDELYGGGIGGALPPLDSGPEDFDG